MIQMNQPAEITAGILRGHSGTIVAEHRHENTVEIELDSTTSVIIDSRYISQEDTP